MERTQFTFYESFYKAAQRLRARGTRCQFYDAVCQYALFEIPPELDKLPDSVALAFELIRPHLDTSRRRAISGQKGGLSGFSEESKWKANRKQSADKKEIEKENEIEYKSEIERQAREDMERVRRLMAQMQEEERI